MWARGKGGGTEERMGRVERKKKVDHILGHINENIYSGSRGRNMAQRSYPYFLGRINLRVNIYATK